jgi:hypothetical protein
MRHSQVNFRTDCHRVYTVRTTKTSLSAFDSKRYLLEDGIHSYAYGHYKTKPAALSNDDVDEILAGLL